jgi:uncharacterized protein (TIGR02231 family)
MRTLPTALLALLATAAPVLAADVDVQSSVDTVTVYPDGATVTRVIRADLPGGDTTLTARDFPPLLDPASLRVEGEGQARLTIGAIDARSPRPERPATNPDLEKRIEALQDERGTLDDKIAAADARRKFVERFAESSPAGLGEKGEARPLAEWRAAFSAVAEEVAAADDAIRAAKLRQREIDRELARLDSERKANPPRKMEVRIDLAAEAAGSATLRVTYSVRGARWVPLYDARLDTGTGDRKPALELVRRAEIVQQTGEDWSDVALAVSTVRTAKGGSAPSLPPLIVHFPEPPRPVAAAPAGAFQQQEFAKRPDFDSRGESSLRGLSVAAEPKPAPAPAREQEAAADTGGFQALFRIPGRISIATNEGAKSFRVATATIAPDLIVRATPVLDETAYLEAAFKQADEAPLLPGRIALYRDGVFVGRGEMALTPKDEMVHLGFGADDKVKVARAIVRKQESQTGIISSTKVDEREFKITLRNGHDAPVRVTIEDQIPVSETEDVKVELLPVTTPPSERDVKDRRGVLAWSFDAAPGESREIKLGWRVRWPADKMVVYEPRR